MCLISSGQVHLVFAGFGAERPLVGRPIELAQEVVDPGFQGSLTVLAFAAHGVHAATVLVAATAQNTRGVASVERPGCSRAPTVVASAEISALHQSLARF